ncbi:hypothetical protein K2173_015415 [Erythroxylum novogranatense]|uniref:Serine/threonine-protein phosphatase n=1 Tax=Erythroxylum novogranatense TaxID=1862640 RepID=A0AAV8SRP7_9ROSI|nr:hypothetical protein K2173_015415 [Erythroxylum novogranatense]
MEILVEKSNVQRVDAPVTVSKDIHGQFYNMKHHFKVRPVRYPDMITLIRGNHEGHQITQVTLFVWYSISNFFIFDWLISQYCTDIFDYLSTLIGSRIFSVHGDTENSYFHIRNIDTKQELPHDGAMCNLLWSDLEDIVDGWGFSPRGAGFLFGGTSFNHSDNLNSICCAHQLVMEGYKWICVNVAAIFKLDENLNKQFCVFDATPQESRGTPTKNVRLGFPSYVKEAYLC